MLRSFLFLGVVGAMALFATTTASTNPAPVAPLPCPNTLGSSPALIFDVSGGTLLGPVHMHMTVYHSGYVTMARKSEVIFQGTSDIDVQTTTVSQQELNDLLRDLYLVDVYTLCDQDTFAVSDIPLTTVTAFRGRTDAQTHTFSYWLGSGEYAGVSTRIGQFISDHVPAQ